MAIDSVVLGGVWGDEGKSRVIDALAAPGNANTVVRYSGTSNSGHTIYVNGQKYVCHMLPDGVVQPHILNLVTQGVLFDIPQFFSEYDEFTSRGLNLENRIKVSHRATFTLPSDVVQDRLANFNGSSNGSTKKGTRYGYSRQTRPEVNLRLEDLYMHVDSDGEVGAPHISPRVWNALRTLAREVIPLVDAKTAEIAQSSMSEDAKWEALKALEEMKKSMLPEVHEKKLREYADRLRPFIRDTGLMVRDAVREDKGIVYAGAQATLLDKDLGPGVDLTASNASGTNLYGNIGHAYTRDEAQKLYRWIVVKHLPTRVGMKGHGFPTRDKALDERFAIKGNEFGATSGRPRELGHPDAVVVAYSAEKTGADGIIYTKVDLVDGDPTVKLAYAYEIDGQVVRRMPTQPDIFDSARIKPVYHELHGWDGSAGMRSWEALPDTLRTYLRVFEDTVSELAEREVPVVFVSTGKEREDYFLRDKLEELLRTRAA